MIGCLPSSNSCSSTAPSPVPEASVCNINLRKKYGLLNRPRKRMKIQLKTKARFIVRLIYEIAISRKVLKILQ
jgi:hypothetical protein